MLAHERQTGNVILSGTGHDAGSEEFGRGFQIATQEVDFLGERLGDRFRHAIGDGLNIHGSHGGQRGRGWLAQGRRGHREGRGVKELPD